MLAARSCLAAARASHAGVAYNAAMLLHQAGELEEAISWFERAEAQHDDGKVAADAPARATSNKPF